MDKSEFERLKENFNDLTGKNANDNLSAYFQYLILLTELDNKTYLSEIYKNTKK